MDSIPSVGLTEEFFLENLQKECKMCLIQITPKCELKRHVRKFHLNHKICLGKHIVVRCKRNCSDTHGRKVHFHCPECDYITHKATRLNPHFQKHSVKLPEPEISPNTATNIPKAKCVIVDQNEGIFMVSKTTRGINHPIHVMKQTKKPPFNI